jgi:hypothetical protein
MTQTGGLAILFAYLIFVSLLAILAAVVLREPADPVDEAKRSASGEVAQPSEDS